MQRRFIRSIVRGFRNNGLVARGGLFGALLVSTLLFGSITPVHAASEPEETFLAMYFSPEEMHMVSSTRTLKAINRIAENIHVISAAEIALLQAHSLAEVLETIPGVAMENRGGPGGPFVPYIQGSSFAQVAAFLDGVPLNNIGNNFPELTFLPVEEVARIEVVKGPASSAWGSALGGVINVITKTPPERTGFAGSVSGSAGEAETNDVRASLAGRTGAFGYALTAGRLHSGSLADGYDVDRAAVTAKLDYRPDPAWNVGLALYYTGADNGEGLFEEFDEADRREAAHLRAQLTADAFLNGGSLLSFNLWGARNKDKVVGEQISDGSVIFEQEIEDEMGGAGLRYRASAGGHELVFGAEYQDGRSELSSLSEAQTQRKWAGFVNDTFDLGPITLTAGLRRDELDLAGSFLSPSLGAVYSLGSHLLLRAYVARGFTAPTSLLASSDENAGYLGNPDLSVEKVISYQGGVEGDVPGFFWYKVTVFRHDVENGIAALFLDEEQSTFTFVNKDEVRRQGLELDARSASFHGFALEGGAAWIESENRTRDTSGDWFAKSSYRAGLSYTSKKGLHALLHVRRVHWEAPSDFNAAADPIVDLHLSQRIPVPGLDLEIFGAARNLFDGDQFFFDIFPNPRRWLEAGLRLRF